MVPGRDWRRVPLEQVETDLAKQYLPTDPLFAQQWFLRNTGQDILGQPQAAGAFRNDIDVTGVWPDYTGAGVRVGVMDDGFDETHPDLVANYRRDLSHDLVQGLSGTAAASGNDDNHGTAVLGLIAAAQNGVGGVGVAYGAEAVGYRGLITASSVLQEFTAAAQHMISDGIDVSNNSWGSGTSFDPATQSAYATVFAKLATQGRGGLGTVTVFAAGNERKVKSDTNYSPSSNSPYAITIAAAKADGTVASYSTPGTSVLVAAPGSDPRSIVTTDRQGTAGYNARKFGDYTDTAASGFSGTSAATPIASGVVALMLQANPDLGYRDVQEILAYSAHAVTPPAAQASSLGKAHYATDWNGGDHPYNTDLGYGDIDALAAVRMAETWTKQSVAANLSTLTARSSGTSTILPGDFDIVSASPVLSADTPALLRTQHVTVAVDLDVSKPGALAALKLTLVDRTGKESVLLDHTAAASGTHLSFTFDTVKEWGTVLNATGQAGSDGMDPGFDLYVANDAGGGTVTLNSFTVTAYGDAVTADHTYVYTNDYAQQAAADATRETLKDKTVGHHTINAAAVTGDSIVDLRTGGVGNLGGAYFEVADGVTVSTVFTGDGNDRLYGNDMDNVLGAGRGSNTIDGGGGTNTAQMIGTRSGYRLGLGPDGITVDSADRATQDALTRIQALQFSDGTVDLRDALSGMIVAGDTGAQFGQAVKDGYDGLDWQFVAITPERLTIGAALPNIFLRGGTGSDAIAVKGGDNVLDGGGGSDWLVGADGSDGGHDTFFLSGMLEGRTGTEWDTIVNFHAGDLLTVWGYDAAIDTYRWTDGRGADGHTGATLEIDRAGGAMKTLVTLDGVSTGGAQLYASTGMSGVASYLAISRMG